MTSGCNLKSSKCFHFFSFTQSAVTVFLEVWMFMLYIKTIVQWYVFLRAYLFVLFKICLFCRMIMRAYFSSSITRILISFFFLFTRLSSKSYLLNIHIYSVWRSWYGCLKILKNWAILWPKQRVTIFSLTLRMSVRQAKSKFTLVVFWWGQDIPY